MSKWESTPLSNAYRVPAEVKQAASPALQVAFEAAEAGAAVVMDFFTRGVEMRQKAAAKRATW